MPVKQKGPKLSASLDERVRTMAPSHFNGNRLIVICSRGHEHATVRNLDMAPGATAAKPQKPQKVFKNISLPY